VRLLSLSSQEGAQAARNQLISAEAFLLGQRNAALEERFV
jgi:hypothetical protein